MIASEYDIFYIFKKMNCICFDLKILKRMFLIRYIFSQKPAITVVSIYVVYGNNHFQGKAVVSMFAEVTPLRPYRRMYSILHAPTVARCENTHTKWIFAEIIRTFSMVSGNMSCGLIRQEDEAKVICLPF